MSARAGRTHTLPVDPERLKQQFPALSDEDLEAYVAVTRRVLADPKSKGKVLREVMTLARLAQDKTGVALTPPEALAVRYLAALEKMQGR
jgi:hypothetical protein